MSCMEIYVVRPSGDVVWYADARNAFGGAMHIWLTLARQYTIPFTFTETGFNHLWSSIGLMTESDQWVLVSTFDKFIVPREHVPQLVAHWKTFIARYPSPTLSQAMALIERAIQDTNVAGIAFNQTSVVDTWAVVPHVDGGDDNGEARPYNINKETGHKYLTPEYIRACSTAKGSQQR